MVPYFKVMLSKACQYALKAIILISANQVENNPRLTLNDISKAIGSPPAFTSKILQKLVSAKVISSTKGGGGGFSILPSKIKSVKIITIIKIIEGDHLTDNCFLGLPSCSERNPCPVHYHYAPIREMLNSQLLSITLAEIIDNPGVGRLYLKL